LDAGVSELQSYIGSPGSPLLPTRFTCFVLRGSPLQDPEASDGPLHPSRYAPSTRTITVETGRVYRVRTPLFTPYSEVKHLLRLLADAPRAEVRQMMQHLYDQTGTPQNPVDWTDPDTWIEERLDGASARLARRIWEGSGREVSPRYMTGSYLFINTYDLLRTDANGIYRLTERGRSFLNDDAETVQELDRSEGLDELLSILSTKQRAMRGDLLPEWGTFLKEHSKFGTPATTKDTLRRRLLNLVERGYVERDGNSYSISEAGTRHLKKFHVGVRSEPRWDVNRAVAAHNQVQRRAFRERLEAMNPLLFERLVRDLLEEMGYEDVQVTRPTGDKGVDVIGTVQLGITSVTEVVQVKRHRGSIGRPVLDQLRGALPYHKAIRGTIITIGTFSKGCPEAALYPGAAPITLIDGERLLDLLIEHQVGVQKREIQLLELDEEYFATTAEPMEPELAAVVS
jgi:restriction system protein